MRIRSEGWYMVMGVGERKPEDEPQADEATQEELEELNEDLEDEEDED